MSCHSHPDAQGPGTGATATATATGTGTGVGCRHGSLQTLALPTPTDHERLARKSTFSGEASRRSLPFANHPGPARSAGSNTLLGARTHHQSQQKPTLFQASWISCWLERLAQSSSHMIPVTTKSQTMEKSAQVSSANRTTHRQQQSTSYHCSADGSGAHKNLLRLRAAVSYQLPRQW